jgi:hypothetical protein
MGTALTSGEAVRRPGSSMKKAVRHTPTVDGPPQMSLFSSSASSA